MTVEKIIGVAASIVVLAGISVAIVHGNKTAAIIGSIGEAFTSSIKAATAGGR